MRPNPGRRMTAPTRERMRAAVAPSRSTTSSFSRPAGTGETVWDDERKFYAPRFPSAARLGVVAANLDDWVGLPAWDGREGSRARIEVAPGLVRIRYKNLARHEHTAQRAAARHPGDVDQLAEYFARHGEFPPDPAPTRRITGWSQKSRSNFWAASHELDYEPMLRRGHTPAMVTLTYPGEWLMLCPTGSYVKRHMKILRKRVERTWRRQLQALWKLEFQRRGAPHIHLMMVPPHGKAPRGRFAGLTFKRWLSETWADIVDHPDPDEYARHVAAGTAVDYREGLRASDPRRVAVYFAKHGAYSAKEYQNQIPAAWQEPGAGPGRFWGYWNLKRRVHGVELTHEMATIAARTIRRYARAQGVITERAKPRYRGGQLRTAEPVIGLAGAQEVEANKVQMRRQRRRAKRMGGKYGAGWLSVNDGAHFFEQLGRYLGAIADPLPG